VTRTRRGPSSRVWRGCCSVRRSALAETQSFSFIREEYRLDRDPRIKRIDASLRLTFTLAERSRFIVIERLRDAKSPRNLGRIATVTRDFSSRAATRRWNRIAFQNLKERVENFGPHPRASHSSTFKPDSKQFPGSSQRPRLERNHRSGSVNDTWRLTIVTESARRETYPRSVRRNERRGEVERSRIRNREIIKSSARLPVMRDCSR